MNNTRQRVLILSLLLFLLVPVFSLSESSYAPKLGMTMEGLIAALILCKKSESGRYLKMDV